jgi:hypothetical protein
LVSRLFPFNVKSAKFVSILAIVVNQSIHLANIVFY